MQEVAQTLNLAGVIGFLSLMSDASAHGKMDLVLHDIRSSMRLDSAAQRALNVFPQKSDEAKLHSLFGLLNQARTAMGKRKLKVGIQKSITSAWKHPKFIKFPASLTAAVHAIRSG